MKVIAVDLIDTLVKRPDAGIIAAVSGYPELSALGLEGKEFYGMFRKRYLEYSMGNYLDDEEFLEVLGQDCGVQDKAAFARCMMEVIQSTTPPLAEATTFLMRAKKKWNHIIIASNYVYGWAKQIISKNKWEDYFDDMVISSDIGCRKPAKRFFDKLVETAGTESSNIYLVGDSLVNDIYGSSQVGIVGILLDSANKAQNYGGKTVRSLLEVFDIVS